MAPVPATRLLALLELLQSRSRFSGAELARVLAIDRRTVRRYVAQLEELGIPVVAVRGRDGGYGLVAGFKLPPMMFSNDEALALALGLVAARSLGLADSAPAIASALAKLERVLPQPLRAQVRAIDETVSVDAAPAQVLGDNAALSVLSAAARAQQRVCIAYRAADGSDTERNFDPYGLAMRGGHWYVAGHCHLRGGLRSFRLDRVLRVAPLPASFRRPSGFDALAHITLSMATLPRSVQAEVLLHAPRSALGGLFLCTLGVVEAAGDATLLRIQVDDVAWLARELARCPVAFTIRAPDALRGALRDHAARLQAIAVAGA